VLELLVLVVDDLGQALVELGLGLLARWICLRQPTIGPWLYGGD